MTKVANVQFYENANECHADKSQRRLQSKRYTYVVPTNMEVKPGDICVVRVYNDNTGPFRFVCVDTVEDKVLVNKHKFLVARLDIEHYLEQEKLEEARAEAREFMRRKALELAEDQQYMLVMNRLTPEEREYVTKTLGISVPVTTTDVKSGSAYYKVTDGIHITNIYTGSASQAIEIVSERWGVKKEDLTATIA